MSGHLSALLTGLIETSISPEPLSRVGITGITTH